MRNVHIFLAVEPVPTVDAEGGITWPQYACDPVLVWDNFKADKKHWEVLISKEQHEKNLSDNELDSKIKKHLTFSTAPIEFKKDTNVLRHYFGAPGKLRDPSLLEEISMIE